MKSNPAIVTEVSSRLVAHGHVTSAFESMSCHTFQSWITPIPPPHTQAYQQFGLNAAKSHDSSFQPLRQRPRWCHHETGILLVLGPY